MAFVAWFLPSLGLFSLLNHWKAEQIPFSVRLEAAEDNIMTSGDIIYLNNMKRNVLWNNVDRYNYTSPENTVQYSLYTGLALGESFVVFLVITALHLLIISITKILTVPNIRKERKFDVFTHIIENLNFPFPYKDWDVDYQSNVDDYKKKLKEVNTEMAWSSGFNMLFNALMFTPFWWTGYKSNLRAFEIILPFLVHKITERHKLLVETILPREDETEAYKRAHYLNNCLTPVFLTALVLETLLFYLYTNMVNCQ